MQVVPALITFYYVVFLLPVFLSEFIAVLVTYLAEHLMMQLLVSFHYLCLYAVVFTLQSLCAVTVFYSSSLYALSY